MNKQIVNFEDKSYIINKVLTVKKDPPFDLVEELQHYYHSNKVLKKENKELRAKLNDTDNVDGHFGLLPITTEIGE